ncbi:N-acetylglucosaminyl deacetylase, LmbE family [Salinimicrobium catena]|uniref:N-acetylglucosaminyl deacetylase, LmbE family n=1 Tax=Salinimicrobium catena TaxID=390640 RepID=A0A1H5KV28_9FLAO|nr:PIG-L family deacetylase [Salinimicrobium catena]SDL02196.1 N-acetylglucosaminyl deacetylase, LmbE family [Salinimicrobium catena]SEE68696.1 N-acetylglucosaminyl deacetylase, LmbE family [Salinimicrobium catena]
MRKVLSLLLFIVFSQLQAQQPEKWNSSEIFQEIKKLNFLGSVLYVAAHPDDENTRLISYLSNELNARTAYLSLTRGDGGQNLIGPQLREMLGIIRTQELLAARKIDGGEQFFTRANDFGYSKNPEETLQIWNEEEILKDVVRTIRSFKPDIVINRFKANSAGETHGHHTSSAILSQRAFKLAGESEAFPQLAQSLGTWQPKKLFFNTSPWFYDSQEAFEAADKSNFLEMDTGVYYPLKGMSNTEIASLSRSQHQSQGFGSTGTRGETPEYIELIGGQHPEGSEALFAGINTTWSRVEGGEEIGQILKNVEENYDFKDPSASVPQLVKAYSLILKLKDAHWKKIKSAEITEIIAACAGLYLEAVSEESLATPGEEINLNLEAINRSDLNMQLSEVKILPAGRSVALKNPLQNNEPWLEKVSAVIPEETEYTSPYWLQKKGSLGMYHVEAPELIGHPETPRQVQVEFQVQIDGQNIPFRRNVVYKKNDPVKGETYQPFEIVPPISVSTADDVLIFANHAPKMVPVRLRAMKDSVTGTLKIKQLRSWKIEPVSYSFGPLQKGEEITFTFEVTAPDFQNSALLQPVAIVDSEEFSKEVVRLDYEHIPMQTIVLPAEIKLVKLDVQKNGKLIGYLEGAGDAVPRALEQMGYTVDLLTPQDISSGALKKYDAVVLGIRAFNVVDALQQKNAELFKYVHDGGNLIVQYNTSRGLVTKDLAPYPLQLSHDRVTNEDAKVEFLNEDHPVLNFPNKITSEDFEGWVQERGLYFPNEWSYEFTPVLSMHDTGEAPKQGSLLIAPYGKGNYIYTGLSFFREFPAGVPGAFRLFANMLSLKNATQTKPSK